jgi:DNA-binding NarL/FixJ family response regulator
LGFEVAGQAGNVPICSPWHVRSGRSWRSSTSGCCLNATEGLEATRVIREELPGTAIIVLSAHVEVDEVTDLLVGGGAPRLPPEEPGD